MPKVDMPTENAVVVNANEGGGPATEIVALVHRQRGGRRRRMDRIHQNGGSSFSSSPSSSSSSSPLFLGEYVPNRRSLGLELVASSDILAKCALAAPSTTTTTAFAKSSFSSSSSYRPLLRSSARDTPIGGRQYRRGMRSTSTMGPRGRQRGKPPPQPVLHVADDEDDVGGSGGGGGLPRESTKIKHSGKRANGHSSVVYFSDKGTDHPVEIGGGGKDCDDGNGEYATDFPIANAAIVSPESATYEGQRSINFKAGIIVAPTMAVANDGGGCTGEGGEGIRGKEGGDGRKQHSWSFDEFLLPTAPWMRKRVESDDSNLSQNSLACDDDVDEGGSGGEEGDRGAAGTSPSSSDTIRNFRIRDYFFWYPSSSSSDIHHNTTVEEADPSSSSGNDDGDKHCGTPKCNEVLVSPPHDKVQVTPTHGHKIPSSDSRPSPTSVEEYISSSDGDKEYGEGGTQSREMTWSQYIRMRAASRGGGGDRDRNAHDDAAVTLISMLATIHNSSMRDSSNGIAASRGDDATLNSQDTEKTTNTKSTNAKTSMTVKWADQVKDCVVVPDSDYGNQDSSNILPSPTSICSDILNDIVWFYESYLANDHDLATELQRKSSVDEDETQQRYLHSKEETGVESTEEDEEEEAEEEGYNRKEDQPEREIFNATWFKGSVSLEDDVAVNIVDEVVDRTVAGGRLLHLDCETNPAECTTPPKIQRKPKQIRFFDEQRNGEEDVDNVGRENSTKSDDDCDNETLDSSMDSNHSLLRSNETILTKDAKAGVLQTGFNTTLQCCIDAIDEGCTCYSPDDEDPTYSPVDEDSTFTEEKEVTGTKEKPLQHYKEHRYSSSERDLRRARYRRRLAHRSRGHDRNISHCWTKETDYDDVGTIESRYTIESESTLESMSTFEHLKSPLNTDVTTKDKILLSGKTSLNSQRESLTEQSDTETMSSRTKRIGRIPSMVHYSFRRKRRHSAGSKEKGGVKSALAPPM